MKTQLRRRLALDDQIELDVDVGPASVLPVVADNAFDFLDRFLLSGTPQSSDDNLSFRKLMGDEASNTICFLPWMSTLESGQQLRLAPSEYYACYQLPEAVVSSEPNFSARAMQLLFDDACRLIDQSGKPPDTLTIIGSSMGSAPATAVANHYGARLISAASADRGDLMLWESPAARSAKNRAIAKGYELEDFTAALKGWNIVDNLCNIADDSVFFIGERDLYVPRERREALVLAVRRLKPSATIQRLDKGHFRTIIHGAQVMSDA